MAQRAKLELELNRPAEIKLLFDEPIVGESQYGSYYLYAVESNGEEYSFFAPEEVHNQIKLLSKGDTAVITKTAYQQGNRLVTKYNVNTPVNAERSNKARSIGEAIDELLPSDNAPEEDAREDKLYKTMLQSLEEAIRIANKLGGIVDINRIGITLFIARSKVGG